jgi:hypothetical protein
MVCGVAESSPQGVAAVLGTRISSKHLCLYPEVMREIEVHNSTQVLR